MFLKALQEDNNKYIHNYIVQEAVLKCKIRKIKGFQL